MEIRRGFVRLLADEFEVPYLGRGRFLGAAIGFASIGLCSRTLARGQTGPQFRGFSRLLVYNAGDAIQDLRPERKLKALRNLGLGRSIQAVP